MQIEPIQTGDLSPPAPRAAGKKRRGVVLVAVLIVVASLSLAGYHYSDSMTAESKASEYAFRNMQVRAFAESGIHYTAALLSNPDSYANELNGNPWNNKEKFQGISVAGENLQGYFSIIAPPNQDDGGDPSVAAFGVSDEGAKINLNSMMKLDPTGEKLHDMLVKLPAPNMTEEIANNIVAWLGGSYGIQNGGAQTDAYQFGKDSYRSKNGPMDSIDELLLVKGVTRDKLYGNDLNRNGFQDDHVNDAPFDRGWSAYLTVHSREQNSDQARRPYVFLNNTDVALLATELSTGGMSENMAKFIIMYRQYGPSNTSGKSQGLGASLGALFSGGNSSSSSSATKGDLASYQLKLLKPASYTIKSLFDLVNAQVTIKNVDPNNKKKTITTIYSSPLNEPAQLIDQMAKLYAATTLLEGAEIPARINVNTASSAVLATLPGVTEGDVQKIIAGRPQLSSLDASSANIGSPVWMLTSAQLDLKLLRDLEPYITARTQVYRVQSVGYFDAKGPAVRLEAVIDTNAGRPRIIAWRDLTELGKGFNDAVTAPSP